ncbi:MAG TPA: prepilin-type N-terminal cleavage/methylation domain-containing protein [Gemmatimonadales bacterium]|nr:prepilin-type N-terminal cleavage/methylation domain-containing protein [Gemmatimonadales bacterium]
MTTRPTSRRARGRAQRGFTMVELALTICVIGILTAMMVPKIGRVVQATRLNREIAIVATDLEQAFTLAARYRKPMRLTVTTATQTYTIADRTGGTVRLSRKLGADADLGTLTMTVSTSPVDIFPSGVSGASTTIRITSGISTRAVVMTTAGQVRIIP